MADSNRVSKMEVLLVILMVVLVVVIVNGIVGRPWF